MKLGGDHLERRINALKRKDEASGIVELKVSGQAKLGSVLIGNIYVAAVEPIE